MQEITLKTVLDVNNNFSSCEVFLGADRKLIGKVKFNNWYRAYSTNCRNIVAESPDFFSAMRALINEQPVCTDTQSKPTTTVTVEHVLLRERDSDLTSKTSDRFAVYVGKRCLGNFMIHNGKIFRRFKAIKPVHIGVMIPTILVHSGDDFRNHSGDDFRNTQHCAIRSLEFLTQFVQQYNEINPDSAISTDNLSVCPSHVTVEQKYAGSFDMSVGKKNGVCFWQKHPIRQLFVYRKKKHPNTLVLTCVRRGKFLMLGTITAGSELPEQLTVSNFSTDPNASETFENLYQAMSFLTM